MEMEPLFEALSAFRQQQFERCVSFCDVVLQNRPGSQSGWSLKCRALSELCRSETDYDVSANQMVADTLLDEAMAESCRPGTSLRAGSAATRGTATGDNSKQYSQARESVRPVSGVARPLSSTGAARQKLRSSRATTAATVRRPVTAYTDDGQSPFINVSRLNLAKIAQQPAMAKPLFLYIYHCENDAKNACELAVQASRAVANQDWWWLQACGRCFYRMGMLREAEANFNTAFNLQPMVITCLLLAHIYIRMDQPMSALDTYKRGLDHFTGQVCLLNRMARVREALGDISRALRHYKEAVCYDATSVEAVAFVAGKHFHHDQPELALTLYRRLLQMGVCNAEIFNNLALCCFHAQQFDMVWTCFQRALTLADDHTCSDVWYNMGHVATAMADVRLACQCYHLAVKTSSAAGSVMAEAYNNLGVLEQRTGNDERARAHYQTAAALAPHLYEPVYNWAAMCEKSGDLQQSFILVQQSLSVCPEHVDSQQLLSRLKHTFSFSM